MATGTVKWFNHTKSYGFIIPDEGGPDVFLHAYDLRHASIHGHINDLRLSFDVAPGKDGKPRARNLALLNGQAKKAG